MIIDQRISSNFNVLKFFSILMVFFGHFFQGIIPLVWFPVTVGLIIFGFSSGYFTAIKYRGDYQIKSFYIRKAERLAVNLGVIYIFLLLLFIIKNESNIWTWQTLVNIAGLNGLLEWFFIDNISPFGNGMWFLTLLFIFYFVYPLLEKLRGKQLYFLTPVVVGFAYIISTRHNPGHAIWLAVCAFYIGVMCAKNNFKFIKKRSGYLPLLSISCLLIMTLINLKLQIRYYNFIFILIFSFLFICSMSHIELWAPIYRVVGLFSVCLLEIYLLHSYLFIRISDIPIVDFILSVCLVISISMGLNYMSNFLLGYIKKVTKLTS